MKSKLMSVAIAVAGTMVLGLLGSSVMSGVAESNTAPNLRVITVKNDRWFNWDFSENVQSRTGVDWPINVIFGYDAKVNRVKCNLFDPYQYGKPYASSQSMKLLNNNSVWAWDQDAGMKTALASVKKGYHYRVYAPESTDRFYNPGWRFYTIGSTHIDYSEATANLPGGLRHDWYGRSEEAEGKFQKNVQGILGKSRVRRNVIPLGNSLYENQVGRSKYLNNGEATWVKIVGEGHCRNLPT